MEDLKKYTLAVFVYDLAGQTTAGQAEPVLNSKYSTKGMYERIIQVILRRSGYFRMFCILHII